MPPTMPSTATSATDPGDFLVKFYGGALDVLLIYLTIFIVLGIQLLLLVPLRLELAKRFSKSAKGGKSEEAKYHASIMCLVLYILSILLILTRVKNVSKWDFVFSVGQVFLANWCLYMIVLVLPSIIRKLKREEIADEAKRWAE